MQNCIGDSLLVPSLNELMPQHKKDAPTSINHGGQG
jgi:hypothetical protein